MSDCEKYFLLAAVAWLLLSIITWAVVVITCFAVGLAHLLMYLGL